MSDARDIVNQYYQAWRGERSFESVPIASDLKFVGSIDQFTNAQDFLAMTRQFVPQVKEIAIRHQLVDGDTVCTVYDFVTSLPVGPIPTAEVIQVVDDQIQDIELIYDARELAKVLS